jgi:hypothetical protein
MTDLPGLDDPLDDEPYGLRIFHRDGTPAKTRREGYEILEHRFDRGGKSKNPDRGRVAQTNWRKKTVSTVFLALNHAFSDDAPPLIFETMVFDATEGMGEQDADRYATEAEAKEGHLRMVEAHLGRIPALIYRWFPWYEPDWPRPFWERFTPRRWRQRRRRNE